MTREKRQRLKKIDDDIMPTNCNVVIIFPIYGQFGAIWKSDSECMICETYIFINSNFLSYENWKQNLTFSNTALILLIWVEVLFLIKNYIFCKKVADISKSKGILALKGIFVKLHVCEYLHTKFQVSRIILNSNSV